MDCVPLRTDFSKFLSLTRHTGTEPFVCVSCIVLAVTQPFVCVSCIVLAVTRHTGTEPIVCESCIVLAGTNPFATLFRILVALSGHRVLQLVVFCFRSCTQARRRPSSPASITTWQSHELACSNKEDPHAEVGYPCMKLYVSSRKSPARHSSTTLLYHVSLILSRNAIERTSSSSTAREIKAQRKKNSCCLIFVDSSETSVLVSRRRRLADTELLSVAVGKLGQTPSYFLISKEFQRTFHFD